MTVTADDYGDDDVGAISGWYLMSDSNTLVAGRYRLRAPIGRGGMSCVWVARDEVLHRDVAVKEIVPPSKARRADLRRMFDRVLAEAQAIARLDHHNVVQIYDLVHFRRKPWIVMEYVRSRSLHEVIAVDGTLPPAYVASIGLQILDALTAAHAVGVLHRDVSPRNTLIAIDGRAVLSDFGLATWKSWADHPESEVMGTASYVAPERVSTGESTPQSDFWSLGATLYAAVEGRSPYARASIMETVSALLADELDPPRRAGELGAVLRGLLIREPDRRLRPGQARRLLRAVTVGEMVPELRDLIERFPDWGGRGRIAAGQPTPPAEWPEARRSGGGLTSFGCSASGAGRPTLLRPGRKRSARTAEVAAIAPE